MRPEPRIALVQDALPYMGGAEKVLAAVLERYPQSQIHTIVFNSTAFTGTTIADHPIIPSWLNILPGATRMYKAFTPLLPMIVENMDLRGYDIIISFSYAFAHGVLALPHQLHVSYKATPLRYAWQGYQEFIRQGGPVRGFLLAPILHYLRLWDVAAAQRVDHFLACSEWIGRGVWRAYHRIAHVIYPPVDVDRFKPIDSREPYYVVLCRLVEHKRLDLLVEAFNRLGLPLLVVGDGPQRRRLQRRAAENIRFLGWQPEESVAGLLGRARAFVYASLEDFGIVLAEAQAAGCPVIAYGKGGAAEIVVDGQTGVLFEEQSIEAIIQAVSCFETDYRHFEPRQIRQNALRFSKARFQDEFCEQVESLWQSFQKENYP